MSYGCWKPMRARMGWLWCEDTTSKNAAIKQQSITKTERQALQGSLPASSMGKKQNTTRAEPTLNGQFHYAPGSSTRIRIMLIGP
mmetsp:Transcript_5991/g.10838  ORF Transcript_5991/g.10838 Transcript_5991/m.10838 type:complete len:85 (+) Transcript_5991:270-524(+)